MPELEKHTKVEEVDEVSDEVVVGVVGGGATVENTMIRAPLAVTVTCCCTNRRIYLGITESTVCSSHICY